MNGTKAIGTIVSIVAILTVAITSKGRDFDWWQLFALTFITISYWVFMRKIDRAQYEEERDSE